MAFCTSNNGGEKYALLFEVSMTQSLAACASALDDAEFAALEALEAETMEAAARIASHWRGIESSGTLARAIAIETLPRAVGEYQSAYCDFREAE